MEKCIFSGNNEIEALQVKELLENNGINTYTKNLHTQNLFGATKMFTGMDLIAGNIEIYVTEDNFDKAFNIIKEYFDTDEGEPSEENIDYVEKTDIHDSKNYYEKSIIGKSFFLSLFSFLFSPTLFNIGYLIYLFKNKRKIAVIYLLMTIIFSSLSILGIVAIGADYGGTVFIINIFLIPIFCIIRGISIYVRKKSLLSIIYIFVAIIIIVFFSLLLNTNVLYGF